MRRNIARPQVCKKVATSCTCLYEFKPIWNHPCGRRTPVTEHSFWQKISYLHWAAARSSNKISNSLCIISHVVTPARLSIKSSCTKTMRLPWGSRKKSVQLSQGSSKTDAAWFHASESLSILIMARNAARYTAWPSATICNVSHIFFSDVYGHE